MTFNQDDYVRFDIGTIKGIGKVCGVSEEYKNTHSSHIGSSLIGRLIILENVVSNIDETIYPYHHILCSEYQISELNYFYPSKYFYQGFLANCNSKGIGDNPYDKRYQLHVDWANGWEAANAK